MASVPVYETKGIGDINSREKGSGARYNSGKPAMELIPVWIVFKQENNKYNFATAAISTGRSPQIEEALHILYWLGLWQKNQGTIESVFDAFKGDYWSDCAKVFDYGRNKYAAWNWAKGMAWSVPVACIVRHALAIIRGEENDPESGLPHRGHIACNVVMLAQYEMTYLEGDDRPVEVLTVDKTKKSS